MQAEARIRPAALCTISTEPHTSADGTPCLDTHLVRVTYSPSCLQPFPVVAYQCCHASITFPAYFDYLQPWTEERQVTPTRFIRALWVADQPSGLAALRRSDLNDKIVVGRWTVDPLTNRGVRVLDIGDVYEGAILLLIYISCVQCAQFCNLTMYSLTRRDVSRRAPWPRCQ